MPISTLNSYIGKISSSYQVIPFNKVVGTNVANRLTSNWLGVPNGGSAPATSSVTCSSATIGSLGQSDSNGVQRLARVEFINGDSGYNSFICDRLVHNGSLDATVSGSIIISSSALPRYTNGIGVFAAVEIYVQIGNTTTTISASYTNEQGQSGRLTPPMPFGGSGFVSIRTLIVFSLAQGDVGIRSIESINVAASTTGAGNYGIVLFKPLFNISGLIGDDGQSQEVDGIFGAGGNLPIIQNGACLAQLIRAGATTNPAPNYVLRFIEE